MSKIICDICGTTYQDTAECCPICGCARDAAADLLGEEFLEEEIVDETEVDVGRVSPRKKEIFDYDEVNAEPEEDEEEEDYDEEEDEEEAPRHNTVVVILLTVLIAGLLIAAGFIFFRYFLPNMKQDEPIQPETTVWVEPTTEAAEQTVPCEQLFMLSAGVAELSTPGQQFLIHMQMKPENTTDKIIYTSGNESIATVTEDGRITAVSEGETTIFISCGKVSLECPVVVKYVEETEPPTTAAAETEATEAAQETQPQAETQPQEPAQQETVPAATAAPSGNYDPSIVLKLKKTDIMLGVYYYVTLQLDCDLEPTDVEWSSEHPHIAKVDEKGVVTALKAGTTDIVAKYGDQVVKCRVRCG